ncbi:MAG TPA: hypothetical protein VHT96_05770 [Clostridia bacterium]|nr:hypothetical protein [Clostridia bacterium]
MTGSGIGTLNGDPNYTSFAILEPRINSTCPSCASALPTGPDNIQFQASDGHTLLFTANLNSPSVTITCTAPTATTPGTMTISGTSIIPTDIVGTVVLDGGAPINVLSFTYTLVDGGPSGVVNDAIQIQIVSDSADTLASLNSTLSTFNGPSGKGHVIIGSGCS